MHVNRNINNPSNMKVGMKIDIDTDIVEAIDNYEEDVDDLFSAEDFNLDGEDIKKLIFNFVKASSKWISLEGATLE